MNMQNAKTGGAVPLLRKIEPGVPALKLAGPAAIAIKAGTMFAGRTFDTDTPVRMPTIVTAGDYGVVVGERTADAVLLTAAPTSDFVLGGFHFAPGGNAPARSGGDAVAQINSCSVWDVGFRPACPDPRGMTLVAHAAGRFWCDIYLLGVDHRTAGTSSLGATIADGNSPPQRPTQGRFKKLDYETALAVMQLHGKGLLGVEEFFAAAFGVTERTCHDGEPDVTALDAARTSRWGVMQATGNMWVWGHDGDPDLPRASIFGGSWHSGDDAGSRCADVACVWPGDSTGSFGARGLGDHLQLD